MAFRPLSKDHGREIAERHRDVRCNEGVIGSPAGDGYNSFYGLIVLAIGPYLAAMRPGNGHRFDHGGSFGVWPFGAGWVAQCGPSRDAPCLGALSGAGDERRYFRLAADGAMFAAIMSR
jgi:hypothetical protein